MTFSTLISKPFHTPNKITFFALFDASQISLSTTDIYIQSTLAVASGKIN